MDTKSNSNTRRGDNSISKKARVVILVRNMSSHPVHNSTKEQELSAVYTAHKKVLIGYENNL